MSTFRESCDRDDERFELAQDRVEQADPEFLTPAERRFRAFNWFVEDMDDVEPDPVDRQVHDEDYTDEWPDDDSPESRCPPRE